MNYSFFLNLLAIIENSDLGEEMKKETILRKKQQRALRREKLPGKEEEEKTLLLQEKLDKKRKDRERRRVRKKKQLLQKMEEVESNKEAVSESKSAEESSPAEIDLPVDEPPEKSAEETPKHFVMRPHSRAFLREKDEQMSPHKGMMATIQEKYPDLVARLPTDFEARRLFLRQRRGLDTP